MTTPYNPHNGPGHLFDLIDKHVSYGNAALQEHYQKAAQTRAMLKALGCWPDEKHKPEPPRNKKPKGAKTSYVASLAYEWAQAYGKSTIEAAEQFHISANSIHSYRQYRKLPPLRK